jgi:plastocyanin
MRSACGSERQHTSNSGTCSKSPAVAHTVTADDGTSFDSGSTDPKAAFTFTPTAVGTFAYHCTFHPWMKATLV